MSKVNSFLSQRLKVAGDKLSKMTGLAEMSTTGGLSSFSGVFRVTELTEKEQNDLQLLLAEYKNDDCDIIQDLRSLTALTSEVKAINNQAAILHGERIKRAQELFKTYRDGAFSNWLLATYGNRQTPYNFLQYYELHQALPQILHVKLDEMPRQAVYTLASRSGPFEKKEEIIKNYQGEPKQQLLTLIRETFPLEDADKRGQDLADQVILQLSRIQTLCSQRRFKPTEKQKEKLKQLLTLLEGSVNR
jgi:hypothetical protein